MGTGDAVPAVELSSSECWGLLREAVVGRMAVIVDDHPEIFPVNHIVDRGSLVFRTAAGTKLSASVGHVVAFEVDGYDPVTGNAWSVVVKGRAVEVTRLYEVLEAVELPLFPWHSLPKPRFVRIDADSITGRRFRVQELSRTPGQAEPTDAELHGEPE